MHHITVGQSFDYFLDTLCKCSLNILDLPNDMIDYYILEESSVNIPTFMGEYTLKWLLYEGIIDSLILDKCRLLRSYFLITESKHLWNANSIKQSKEWKDLFKLSDDIICLVYQKWTTEEVEYLKSL